MRDELGEWVRRDRARTVEAYARYIMDQAFNTEDMQMTDDTTPKPSKAHRGFAAMSKDMHRDIAKRGGQAAHAAGTAHEWTRESAKEAGRKGGLASAQDRARMAEQGRRGGIASGKVRRGESKP